MALLFPPQPGGSLMFTPELSLSALRTMHEKFGDRVYGRYGFVDAFNPQTGWVDSEVIGINVGIILLSAENMRTGNVWRWFMRNHEIPRAMQKIGLVKEHRRNKGLRAKRKALGALLAIERTDLVPFTGVASARWSASRSWM